MDEKNKSIQCEKTDSTKESNQLLMHIHEQFAVNNNSALNSLIVLFVALFAVLGAYGYKAMQIFDNQQISGASLAFISISGFGVLLIVALLSISQGYKFRSEQKVIDDIRSYYGLNKTFNDKCPIPWTAESKGILKYCPGLYGLFTKIILGVILFMYAMSLYIFSNYKLAHQSCNDMIDNVILISVFFTICIVAIISTWVHFFCKYINLYKEVTNQEKEKNDKK